MTRTRSIRFIAAALLAAGATTIACCADAIRAAPSLAAPFGAPRKAIDVLDHAGPWLTPVPDGVTSLRGKVVLVNFWTYSCINSLRALPYLRAWQERYGDKGLVVVGVHAPEFRFEHDPAKVRQATARLDVGYPNLQDNDYAVWQAFGNQGWPGFYFIDAKGQVRGYRVGEGDYAESEQLIRRLLAEAGHDPAAIPVTPIQGSGIEAPADWRNLASGEAYLGHDKATGFRSPGGLRRDATASYRAATDLPLGGWDLSGDWTVGSEFSRLDAPNGTLRYRFHARDAHLVLGGAPDGHPIRFRVTIDGAAPGASHGADTNAQGWGEVRDDRLYQLVRQNGPIRDRTIAIQFARPGARAYSFTFG